MMKQVIGVGLAGMALCWSASVSADADPWTLYAGYSRPSGLNPKVRLNSYTQTTFDLHGWSCRVAPEDRLSGSTIMTRTVTCVDPTGYLVQLTVGCDRANGPGAYGSVVFGPRSNPLLETLQMICTR